MRALTKRPQGRARRGFTIIELVVAMVILTMGLLAMAANSAVIGRQVRTSHKMTQASNLAQARFETLRSAQCTTLTGGNQTVGEIVEIWTRTNGTRVVEVTDTVKFNTPNGQQVYAYRTSIPCPALP
jgi:prepilin-type N-terminal cleavage/methylation domain-containing protein